MAVITAYKDAGEVVVTEGEAAGSYGAYDDAKTKRIRPALERFRRDFIWVKGGYILILDNVRAPRPVEVTWLVQGAKLEPVAEEQKKYRLSQNKAHCDFQLLADTDFKTVIDVSTAAATSWTHKNLNWQQATSQRRSESRASCQYLRSVAPSGSAIDFHPQWSRQSDHHGDWVRDRRHLAMGISQRTI